MSVRPTHRPATTAPQVRTTSPAAAPTTADVTVVVPVRNDATILRTCLQSLVDQGAARIVVVDGLSTDDSREVARSFGATVLSDEGKGLPWARTLGARTATTRYVALVDADVVMGPGDLARMLGEFVEGGYTGLQAGLRSTSGPGYWGQSLVFHHRTGRSKNWFGVVATLFEREALLEHGFDASFLSGEDIELRWRLTRAGHRVGVSQDVVVEHKFAGDDFRFARSQFLMDGEGLGRMVRQQRLRGVPLLLLPLAAAVRGAALSVVRRRPRTVGYFGAFMVWNYIGILRSLGKR